jgi:hypothetical protein
MKSCYAEFHGGHAEFRREKQRKALFTFPVFRFPFPVLRFPFYVFRFPLILTYQPVVIAKVGAG